MTNKLDRAQMVPGAIVMIGPNKRIHDRSWTDAIWRIEAATGDTILLRRMGRLLSYANVITCLYSEHDWWQAEHMLEAYKMAMAETQSEFAAQCEAADRHDAEVRRKARELERVA